MLLTKLTVGLLAAAVVVASGAVAFACGNRGASPASPPAAASTAAAAPNKEKPEAKKDQPEWGEAADGVQARLRLSKTAWDVGETPELVLDMRNKGENAQNQCRVPNFCEIEWDGQWYRFAGAIVLGEAFFLNPGKQIDDWVKVPLDVAWVRKGGDLKDLLRVAPGKHTVRVAFLFDGGGRLGRACQPVSQPVEIEVGKESAWGAADGGVQARLRTPQGVWKADEAPTFILDLRTVGKATAEALHAYANLEIEVDGAWYWDANEAHRRGKVYLDTDVIPEHANNWLTVTPDKDWALKAPAAGKPEHFPLPPGKHTIRVSYALAYGKGRPVSGPIEIQVGEESAWGDADGGVQARLRTPRAVWNTGEAPTFILDLRIVGKKPVDALKFKTELEIEVDGAWYADANEGDRLTKQFLATDRLDLVEKTTDWLTVAADKDWQIKTPNAAAGKPERFPLPAGKHTIRLSYEVSAGEKTFRPVSGPVEIEVGKETNGQGAATPAVPDDKQTAARRAVDIRKKLDVRIDYELLVPTTLDKALDELLVRQGIPWKVNTPAFVKQGRVGDFIRTDEVVRIDKLTAVSRRQRP